jgi:hypothetical protein
VKDFNRNGATVHGDAWIFNSGAVERMNNLRNHSAFASFPAHNSGMHRAIKRTEHNNTAAERHPFRLLPKPQSQKGELP